MNLEQRTVALLDLIEQYRVRRCAELLDPARAEARDTARGALAEARRRVHTAVVEERKRGATEVGALMAALATDRRLAHQRHDARVLTQAWRTLEERLIERWNGPRTRAQWVDAYLQLALATLPRDAAGWRIEYEPAWNEVERAIARERLQRGGIRAVEFVLLDELTAGLRIISGHNVLDATLAGLTDDRTQLEGRLLHHLREPEPA